MAFELASGTPHESPGLRFQDRCAMPVHFLACIWQITPTIRGNPRRGRFEQYGTTHALLLCWPLSLAAAVRLHLALRQRSADANAPVRLRWSLTSVWVKLTGTKTLDGDSEVSRIIWILIY